MMMKQKYSPSRRLWVILSVVILLVALAVAAALWVTWPHSDAEARRSVALVVTRSWYEIDSDGRPVAYFRDLGGDSVALGATLSADEAVSERPAAGCWIHRYVSLPSCEGRLVTVAGRLPGRLQADARRLAAHTCDSLRRRIADLSHEQTELRYYLRVHGVQDNGYQEIAALAADHAAVLAGLRRVLAVLDSLPSAARLSVRRRATYRAYLRTPENRLARVDCRLVTALGDGSLMLLRTADGRTPEGAEAAVVLPWRTDSVADVVAPSYGGIGAGLAADTAAAVTVVGGRLAGSRHDFPPVLVADGSPVFTLRGHFAGIVSGGRVVSRAQVRSLIRKGGDR